MPNIITKLQPAIATWPTTKARPAKGCTYVNVYIETYKEDSENHANPGTNGILLHLGFHTKDEMQFGSKIL